ncbi:MAG: hypothetical protein H0X64_13535 [Gemmatimonadaceae bacterium]|nr:hypothetical protein [Gemmatimonadaceae bacterium]
MPQLTGTHDISSLLAAKHQSVAEYGEDSVAAVLAADLVAHNMIVDDLMADLAAPTSDRQRLSGTSVSGEMVETDEYGRAATQKATPGQTVGFPLRQFQYSIGWTRNFLKVATPADIAIAQQAAQKAHLQRIRREIQRGLFISANFTFLDHLIDNVSLAVKRLVNADGAAIPEGPNGESFDGASHTHYIARAAALAASDVDALVSTVLEHGHGGRIKIVVSTANAAAIAALSGFQALSTAFVSAGSADARTAATLDFTRADNRLIGYWNGSYEVWTKPWAIANYFLAYDASDARKTLVFREREQSALRGLRVAAEIDLYPLRAQYMESEFGLGVWNRTNGAVLFIGGTSWTDPTIA